MDIKIRMRNSCQEDKFIAMLALMEICGDIGHSTSFRVIFDGDGTAEINCIFHNEELQNKYNVIKKELIANFDRGKKDPEFFEFGV